MRYTNTEPVKTSIPKAKRGALWYYDNKLCFVVFQDCEQDEPGETLVHTFSCDIFPYCVTVWYTFWGTANGLPSPSNTAIFKAHMTWPPPGPIICALALTSIVQYAPSVAGTAPITSTYTVALV